MKMTRVRPHALAVRLPRPVRTAVHDIRTVDTVPDLQRMGGVTGFLKAVDLCEAFHTPVSSHLFMETSVHLLAAAPTGLMLEHMNWWEELFEERLEVVEGYVRLPDRPGAGLGLDRRALERFRA